MNEHDEMIPQQGQEPDTDRIQKAIEKVMDDETATLPLLPIPDSQPELPADELSDDSSAEGDSLLPPSSPARVHRWFFTFMCMNIPLVGWIYLFYLAFNKRVTDRRDFARAYLFYKLVFLIVSAVILGILLYIGIQVLDQVLAYMEML